MYINHLISILLTLLLINKINSTQNNNNTMSNNNYYNVTFESKPFGLTLNLFNEGNTNWCSCYG